RSKPAISWDCLPMALVISVMLRMLKSSASRGLIRCRSCNSWLICRMAVGISSEEAARTRIWSTLVKRTGWGVPATWVVDGCGYRIDCGLVFGYSWLREFTCWVGSVATALALWLAVEADTPATRYLMVVHGASRMSSWSMPIMLAPLGLRTPTTL